MMRISAALALALLVAGAAVAIWDITSTQQRTVVLYTTPALRDLLERDVIPGFERETGVRVAPVYVAAGQQYNRLRMSGGEPEADLFVHASPLYLEKGWREGRVSTVTLDVALDGTMRSVAPGVWHAFAWSPLVAVYPLATPSPPDLATTDARFGFPHPLLSNNGIYAVLFLEETAPAVGARLLDQTRVQPTNARANIGGIADGSFDLTLGYEAVARFYEAQGAPIAYALPVVNGETVTTRVIFSAALIEGDRHPATDDFLQFLFSAKAQDALAKHHFRPAVDGYDEPENALDLSAARTIEYDWTQWEALEATLPRYEVKT